MRHCRERIQIRLGGQLIYDGTDAWQVLETSHPPTYYLSRAGFVDGTLRPAGGGSFCEWKGAAGYLDVVGGAGAVAPAAAWYYPRPSHGYEAITDHVALYAGRMDSVTVAGEQVIPQPGSFYGGWITASVTGPFKGEPGTSHW